MLFFGVCCLLLVGLFVVVRCSLFVVHNWVVRCLSSLCVVCCFFVVRCLLRVVC